MTISLLPDAPFVELPDNAESVYGGMGLRIRFNQDMSILGLRFWGSLLAPAQVQVGTIYNTAGVALTAQAFGAHVNGGWNVTTLGAPFAVTAGTILVIARGPTSRYAATRFYFPASLGPLDGLEGRYIEAVTSQYPPNVVTTSYLMDVICQLPAPPDIPGKHVASGTSALLTASGATASILTPSGSATVLTASGTP